MTEHRLEDIFPAADKVIVMDQGSVIAQGLPREIGKELRGMGHDMFLSMPAPMQIYAGIDNEMPCPLTVREGRQWLSELFEESLSRKRVFPLRQTILKKRRPLSS